ncbi:MAG TPA: ATP-binding protein, partial [bacterium]|nr:ATP-binding protein [bacterium]
NLLQFARPKPAVLVGVDLNALVEEVVDLQAFHPLAKGVVFRKELAPNLPAARTDRESLAQVLTNLLLNALQAMDGQGEITVGTYQTPRGLLLTVRDTGPGIAPENLPRIFEPFFTTKKAGQGTGLGLSLVEMLLGSMGATLAVWTHPGQGTEFLVVLPLEPASPLREGGAQRPRPENANGLATRTTGAPSAPLTED